MLSPGKGSVTEVILAEAVLWHKFDPLTTMSSRKGNEADMENSATVFPDGDELASLAEGCSTPKRLVVIKVRVRPLGRTTTSHAKQPKLRVQGRQSQPISNHLAQSTHDDQQPQTHAYTAKQPVIPPAAGSQPGLFSL